MALDFPANPTPGQEYTFGAIVYEYNGYGWDRLGQENAGGGPTAAPSDGDKGDIIVSGGGYIWQLDPTVVTAAGRALIDDASAAAQRTTLGLGNVDNTSDVNKPISGATQTALNNKYDKTGGTISGAATVTGALVAQADLHVSNGRFMNYGFGGSSEQSVHWLNQSGSKYLHNDGINVSLNGTPFKVTNTTPTTSQATGALIVGGGLGVGGNLFAAQGIFINNASNTTDNGGTVCLEARSSYEPSIAFHRPGLFATKIGLDVDNKFSVGGWSMAADRFTVDASGNIAAPGGLNIGGQAYFADATDATAPTAAAVRTAGGLGVAKAIRAGGAIIAGTTLQSTSYTFFGSSGTHYAGPLDANTEAHAYAAGHYWSYNRATGNLVWSNGSGSGFVVYDNGLAHAQGGFTTPATISAAGAASFGSLSVSGTATLGAVNAAAISGTTGTFSGGGSFGGALSCASLSSGGNIAGTRIDGTSIYSSGILQSAGQLILYNDGSYGFQQGGGYRYQFFAPSWYWRIGQGGGALEWIGDRGVGQEVFFNFRSDAAFIMSYNAAYKPGGGVWGDSSDERIKTVSGDYTLGLDEIKQLQPVRYTFKGNETIEVPPAPAPRGPDEEPGPTPKSAPYPNSPHYGPAVNGTEFIGLIAQAVELVMPGMVKQRVGYIDNQRVTDLRDLNTGELIYALVNAVKTLAARVEALEAAS